MSKLLKLFIFLSEMYYCEYYMQMASLHHFKCPLLLEKFCGLSVIIYWYLTEPTHPLVYKGICLRVSVVV